MGWWACIFPFPQSQMSEAIWLWTDLITSALKHYAKSGAKVDSYLLDIILSYGLNAHEVYSNGLQTWPDCNPSSHAQAVVHKLKDDHDQNGTAELIRYCKRASADPDSRSQCTGITAMSNMSRRSSHLWKIKGLKLLTCRKKVN